jgi:hypothetical protein
MAQSAFDILITQRDADNAFYVPKLVHKPSSGAVTITFDSTGAISTQNALPPMIGVGETSLSTRLRVNPNGSIVSYTLSAEQTGQGVGAVDLQYRANTSGLSLAAGAVTTISGGELNGIEETATGAWVPGGRLAYPFAYGMGAWASGSFSGFGGDAQAIECIFRNTTTDDTPTELFLDGSSKRLEIPDGAMISAAISVSGMGNDGVHYASFNGFGTFQRLQAGDVNAAGLLNVFTVTDGDGETAEVTFDTGTQTASITVTGVAGVTMRWVARVYGVMVSHPA